MQHVLTVGLLAMCILLSWGCNKKAIVDEARRPEDGVYRGVFIDGDSIQINVEIILKDGVVAEASFRHLHRDNDYHLAAEEEPYRSVVQQYQEALDHLIGKNLAAHLGDLYAPETIVSTIVDGYTAATLRSNKIISAIRDAMNRGVYSY